MMVFVTEEVAGNEQDGSPLEAGESVLRTEDVG